MSLSMMMLGDKLAQAAIADKKEPGQPSGVSIPIPAATRHTFIDETYYGTDPPKYEFSTESVNKVHDLMQDAGKAAKDWVQKRMGMNGDHVLPSGHNPFVMTPEELEEYHRATASGGEKHNPFLLKSGSQMMRVGASMGHNIGEVPKGHDLFTLSDHHQNRGSASGPEAPTEKKNEWKVVRL